MMPVQVEPGTGEGGGPLGGGGGGGPIIIPGGILGGGGVFTPTPTGAGTTRASVGPKPLTPAGTGTAPIAPVSPLGGPIAAAADFLNTPGPLGFTYGQIGLAILVGFILFSGSKK